MNWAFVLGSSYIKRADSYDLVFGFFASVLQLVKQKFTINFVSRFLGRLTCCELGFIFNSKQIKGYDKLNPNSIVYLCGLDSSDFDLIDDFTGIYQGCFFDNNFIRSVNIFLPVAIYTESELVFINLEGRLRISTKAVSSLNDNYPDWKIFQSLFVLRRRVFNSSINIIVPDFYNSINFFKRFINYTCIFFYSAYAMKKYINHYFCKISLIISFAFCMRVLPKVFNYLLLNSILTRTDYNYYRSDMFSRNSRILAISAQKLKIKIFNS